MGAVSGPSQRFRRSHAVVIAIDGYRGDVPTLDNACRDALAVGRTLGVDHGFDVTALFERRATRAGVRHLLTEVLPRQVQADDRLIVYFAGHGISRPAIDGPSGYLLLDDAAHDAPDTFFAMRELSDGLARLPCRHLLLILDCCFSGAFRWVSLRDFVLPPTVFAETYDRFVTSPAWQVLTSAASDQHALDALPGRGHADAGHSPFAAALLAGLAGDADLDGDKLITATELYLHVRRAVETGTATSRLQSPGLFPLRRHEHGEFVFQVPDEALDLKSAPTLTADLNPYRGLESFDEGSHLLFFGRDAVVRRLAKTVLMRPITAVVGPSGSGKSSVVAAGLVPLFKARTSPGTRRPWTVIGPLRALDAAGDGVLETLPTSGGVLVVIDQLEELVTQATPAQRSAVMTRLAAWMTQAPDRVRVVVSIRGDFEPHFQTWGLPTRLQDARFVLPAMTQDQLRGAIETPASMREIYFRPASLVDRLINEVVQMPGALPALSFTLSELYRSFFDRRRHDRAIVEADYDAVGGVAWALTRRATHEVAALIAKDPAYAFTARRVLLRMVTYEGGEAARRRVPRAELDFDRAEENPRVEQLLDALIAARLLVAGVSQDGIPYVEPAHDALIRGWDQLRMWLDEDATTPALLRASMEAASLWQRHDRRAAYLWDDDPRLAQVAAMSQVSEPLLNRLETAFIQTSVRHKRWRTIGIVAVAVAVAIILATLALVARARQQTAEREAATAASRGLAAQARELTADRGDLALLLARAASQIADTAESRSALLTALVQEPNRRRFLYGHDAAVTAVALSPDGRHAATADRDGRVILRDLPDGHTRWSKQLTNIAGTPIGVVSGGLDFLADGRLIVTDWEGDLSILNPSTGVVVERVDGVRQVATVVTPPTGRTILVGDNDQLVAFDLTTHRAAATLRLDGKHINSATFTPDGAWVLTGDDGGCITTWSTATWTQKGQPRCEHAQEDAPTAEGKTVGALTFSRRGDQLASSDLGHHVLVWTYPEMEIVDRIHLPNGVSHSVAFSADGSHLAAGTDFAVASWPTKQSDVVEWRHTDRRLTLASDSIPITVAAHATADQLLTGGSDGLVIDWRMAWSSPVGTSLPTPAEAGDVLAVAASPDGSVAYGGDGGKLWLRRGDEPVRTIEINGSIGAAAFAEDGARLAVGREDGVLLLFETSGWTEVCRVAAHRNRAEPNLAKRGVEAIVARGERIYTTGADAKLRAWDQRCGQVGERDAGKDDVPALAVSPDGTMLVAGGDFLVLRWRLPSLEEINRIPLPEAGVSGVAYLDDHAFITSGNDSKLQIWNLDEQEEEPIDTIYRQATSVPAIAADRARGLVYTGGDDGTIVVWDIARREPVGRPLITLPAYAGAVWALAVSPNGELYSAGARGAVRRWDMDARSWGRRACEIANRQLTCDEWKQYLPGRAYRAVCDPSVAGPAPACE